MSIPTVPPNSSVPTSVPTPSPSPTPFPTVDDGMSGGTAFCIFFFFFVLIYFVGGVLVRKFLRGAEWPESIPHYDFWKDLPSLIRDGIMFTINGCKPEMTYERI